LSSLRRSRRSALSASRPAFGFFAQISFLAAAGCHDIRHRFSTTFICLNQNLGTVIAAPITSTHRPWPTRCRISYRGRASSVALDQIRCLDVARLGKRLAVIDAESALHILRTMFA